MAFTARTKNDDAARELPSNDRVNNDREILARDGRAAASAHGQPRREFLAGLAAVGAGALLAGGKLLGQAPAAGANPRRIDAHHHFTSPGVRAALSANNLLPAVRKNWTPEVSLEAMDKAGVELAMISTGQATWRLGPISDAESVRLTRDANDYGAKMVSDHKGRFGLFAALPLPDIDASLKEIAYALDTLKAAGFGITTSWDNKYFGDPMFKPVMEELNRRNAVVYSHPTDPACCTSLIPGLIPNTIEYGTDTTRNIMSLVVNKVPANYPNIRFLFSHAGGTMPFLIERIIGREPAQHLDAPAKPGSILATLQGFYYDTAQTSNAVAMTALKRVVGARQILFGTDFPYSTMVDHVQGLKACGSFTADELRAIFRENTLKVLPKYKTA